MTNRITSVLLISILLLTVFCFSSCTDVASNNQAANGDVKNGAAETSPTAAQENVNKSNATADNSANKANFNPDENAAVNTENLSPDKLIEDLYKRHDNENGPFFQDKNRALVDAYFVKPLADMIWKDATETKDEVGALDFDPLYNAQDTEISDFKVGPPEIKGEKATVIVTFKNFDEPQTLKFLLTKETKAWKIEDIDYGEDSTLTSVFKEPEKKN